MGKDNPQIAKTTNWLEDTGYAEQLIDTMFYILIGYSQMLNSQKKPVTDYEQQEIDVTKGNLEAASEGTVKTVDDVPSGVFGKNTVGAAEKYVPNNIKMAKNNYLKKKGIDAHALKTELVGNKNISHYDLYVDKDSGMLWLYRKGGIGEPIPTYEYIK